MKRVLIIPGLIVVAAIVVAGASLWSSRADVGNGANESLGTPPTPRQQTFQTMLAMGTSAIYVEDQTAGASVVTVGFAVMPGTGFVAIHDSEGGHPGKEIGRSTRLSTGGGEHVEIVTSVPLASGEVYYAILLDADGKTVTDADGVVTLMSFVARVGAEPETGAVQP